MRTTAFLSLVMLAVAGCGNSGSDAAAAPAAKASEPSAQVAVTAVQEATVSSTLTVYGSVEFAPEGTRSISVNLEEVVMSLQVAVGQAVRKGEVLMTLTPAPSARLRYDKLKVDVGFARKEVDRLTSLRTRGLATNTDVQNAERALASVSAELASLDKRQGGGEHVVRAGVAGVVQAVNVALGQVVAPGAPLLTIGNAGLTRVRLGVEQNDLAQLRIGQRVEVQALNVQQPPIVTRLAAIFPHVDARTRLADAVVALPSGHGLLPGAFVRAQIVVEQHPQALVVPRSAVLYDQKQQPYVFVDNGGHAQRLRVATGIEEAQRIEITQGLALSDHVISSGNAQLKDGMAVRTRSSQSSQ